ncbi:hypothetical protein HYC85_017610 [Camellia sinensis]|uniref:Uncharacterized protein n=1 Tax=Camellia sinensis TaxID=4442 RepID=A0A7J7GRW8_CAMSI|nr:hypothetical protein HYC85_017610 [Camellia sinensis]
MGRDLNIIKKNNIKNKSKTKHFGCIWFIFGIMIQKQNFQFFFSKFITKYIIQNYSKLNSKINFKIHNQTHNSKFNSKLFLKLKTKLNHDLSVKSTDLKLPHFERELDIVGTSKTQKNKKLGMQWSLKRRILWCFGAKGTGCLSHVLAFSSNYSNVICNIEMPPFKPAISVPRKRLKLAQLLLSAHNSWESIKKIAANSGEYFFRDKEVIAKVQYMFFLWIDSGVFLLFRHVDLSPSFDELYNHHCSLFCSAAASIDDLFQGTEEGTLFDLERQVSVFVFVFPGFALAYTCYSLLVCF